MSGRRTVDYYVKVMQKIGRLLCRGVEVEEFVVDFEKAIWTSIRHHRRLNRRAGTAPAMYLLIRLLSDEANLALTYTAIIV
ncbi:hypothetical protein DPMN_080326 [Dreissena polymorpha]|uniref:Uncharacterized protein n=1 Tax=Dreissena polymorpha TaxID=45954 RepID=A0A9D4BRP1_DREPO|nr:hypothetical protein DPMN_080326 [Dreissena polymorpha]